MQKNNACLGAFFVPHRCVDALLACRLSHFIAIRTVHKEEVAAAIVAASAAAVADSSGSAATLEASTQMADGHVSKFSESNSES